MMAAGNGGLSFPLRRLRRLMNRARAGDKTSHNRMMMGMTIKSTSSIRLTGNSVVAARGLFHP